MTYDLKGDIQMSSSHSTNIFNRVDFQPNDTLGKLNIAKS